MIAYSYDSDGVYTGPVRCQIDPIRSKREGRDVFLLPASATLINPPAFDPEAQRAAWDGEKWIIENIPQPLPGPVEPTELDRVEAQAMYTALMTDTLLDETEV